MALEKGGKPVENPLAIAGTYLIQNLIINGASQPGNGNDQGQIQHPGMGKSPSDDDYRLTFQQGPDEQDPISILAQKLLDNAQGNRLQMQPVQQRIQKFDGNVLLPMEMKIRSHIFLFLLKIRKKQRHFILVMIRQ